MSIPTLLVLTPEYGRKSWGGLATYVRSVSEAWEARGADVVVALAPTYLDRCPDTRELSEDANRKVVVREASESSQSYATRVLRELSGDVFVYVQDPSLVDIAVHLAELGTPVGLSAISHLPSYGGFSYFDEPQSITEQRINEAELFRLVDFVIAPSRFCADITSRIHRLHGRDIVVSPFGATKFSAGAATSSSAAQPLRVLTVGRLALQKGIAEYVELVKKVPAQTASFVHVGSALEPRYEHQARESGATFLGQMSHLAVLDQMRVADVILSTSLHETFGFAVLEGMSNGLVPVAFEAGALSELFTDASEGFVVRTGDVDGLAAALHRLHVDRSLLQTMGAKARLRAEAFQWDTHVEVILEKLIG